MEPIVNGLKAEFEEELTVVRLDAAVPENAQLQIDYGMRGHPTFAVLDESGAITAQFTGPQSVEILRAAITAVIHQ